MCTDVSVLGVCRCIGVYFARIKAITNGNWALVI